LTVFSLIIRSSAIWQLRRLAQLLEHVALAGASTSRMGLYRLLADGP
jgi:hypothetical protein